VPQCKFSPTLAAPTAMSVITLEKGYDTLEFENKATITHAYNEV